MLAHLTRALAATAIGLAVLGSGLSVVGCGGDGGGLSSPPPPGVTVRRVTCALDVMDDVEYWPDPRPDVPYAWTGRARMSDASFATLDSAIVKLNGVPLRKVRNRNSGSGILTNETLRRGSNTLSVACYRDTKAASDNQSFGLDQR